MMAFAIKTEVRDPQALTFVYAAQKTMYDGKLIVEGDTFFVFASENEGAKAWWLAALSRPPKRSRKNSRAARQTPRVSVSIRRTALAKRPLGRSELKPFRAWNDGQPGTELNFKLYRQATNKIVGLSNAATVFLDAFF